MNLKIVKEGKAGTGEVAAAELEAINAFTRSKLTAEEVYTFSVILCDNEVDRDGECFSAQTLAELKELFVGKTGICDHEWKAGNQKARIYRTELVTEPGKTTVYGAPYTYLKAYAYMLRIPANEELIAEIEAGIKKETSVGCSVARRVCSVCGAEAGACGHVNGESYDGKCCYTILEGAVDAYEWSFVAVPAQRQAGVTKGMKAGGTLEGFVNSAGGKQFAGEYTELKKQAALGRTYLKELRKEVLRLCLLHEEGLYPALSGAMEQMTAEQLQSMQAHYRSLSAKRFPGMTQLPGKQKTVRFDGEAFQI